MNAREPRKESATTANAGAHGDGGRLAQLVGARLRRVEDGEAGPPPPRKLGYPAAVLGLAVAYWATGRLGLLLAIPPGYATAVWPASGIALAGILLGGNRLWPGIALGSFLINVWTTAAGGGQIVWWLLPPALIAGGAALQAVAGAALIRRLVGRGNVLELELRSAYLLALGGPVACVVNASVGVGTLWAFGLVPAANFGFNWWTWWIGDSVGVMIFTPLVLIWSVRPYRAWLVRQLSAAVPLAVLFGLVVLLFVHTSAREQARIRVEFDAWGDRLAQQLRYDIGQQVELLRSLQALFASSGPVRRSQFEAFTDHLLPHLPGVFIVSWNPLVRGAERAAFEAAVRAEGFAGFAIRERAPSGTLVPALARDEYVVVDYFAPKDGNEAALGFDVASEPRRRAALATARSSGEPAITAPIELVQDVEPRAGFLVVLPVFRPAPALAAAGGGGRAAGLRGYVVAAFRMDEVVQRALSKVDGSAQGIGLRVVDATERPDRTLYGPLEPAADAPGALSKSIALPTLGRLWRLELSVAPDYLVAHRSWQAWWLLAAGMLFTGLFGMFLLVLIGRTSVVQRQVTERTAELQKTNDLLLAEMRRSQEFEMEALARAHELSATNRELEQFAYVASHDLQAPLRTVSGFAGLLQRRYGDRLDEQGREFIKAMVGGAKDMQSLIEDLLAFSRVNAERMTRETIGAADAVRRALDALAADVAAAQAEVTVGELPTLDADPRLLTQLFQNLLANGIKFQPRGRRPRLSVTAQRAGAHWHFEVRDNGIGIPPEQLGQLFLMFKRLHRHEDYPGTGIGLALCKKIVQVHGGRIWAESAVDHGTAVHFTLPAAGAAAPGQLSSGVATREIS
ncbi:MAG: CHASE domain-containing protein [Gammaproteobacteria bacterium]|nr:CHASE domain-containing protein [Gammaproteobacteria bacterium]